MHEPGAVELDAIGILEGVDKASLRGDISCAWDYLRHYDRFFREFRREPINVIEIGVANGASLNVWLKYFERAKIVGIDIDPACTRFARGRAEVRIGSQDDPEFLRAVAKEWPPTIVIDDGSHVAAHIATSFETLFPLLAPGGVYVIEDLGFHYWTNGRQPIAVNPHEADYPGYQIHTLIDDLVKARLAHVTKIPDERDRSEIYAEIDEIRVVGGMVAIQKRKPRDIEATAAAADAYLNTLAREGLAKYVRGCFRLAEYLFTHGRLDEALKRADEGAASKLDDVYGMQVRRTILIALGRDADAAKISERIDSFGFPPTLPELVKPPHMDYPHK